MISDNLFYKWGKRGCYADTQKKNLEYLSSGMDYEMLGKVGHKLELELLQKSVKALIQRKNKKNKEKLINKGNKKRKS